jgi:four helix bundle protein
MRSHYRDLAAYQRAAALGDDLHEQVLRWPHLDRHGLGMQLLDAVDSIGANIAEAAGRWSHADRRRLLTIARGSLYETEHWLARAHARGLIDAGTLERLDGVARPLSGLINKPAPG